MNRILICALLTISFFSCIRNGGNKEIPQEVGVEGTEDIAVNKLQLKDLTSNPKNWNKSTVEVQGYFSYKFEDVALYQSMEDQKDRNKAKAIWVDFNSELRSKVNLEDYEGKQIKIRGRVSTQKGHLMQYAGTIEDVYFIALVKE